MRQRDDIVAPAAATAAALLGSSTIPVSGLLKSIPIVETQALRYAFGTLVLFPLALTTRPKTRLNGNKLRRVAVAALTGAVLFNAAVLLAVRTTDPSIVSVIVGCAPLATILAFAARERRTPDRRLALCAALVFGGNIVGEGGGEFTTQGVLFAFLALMAEVIFALAASSLAVDVGVIWLSTLTSAIALLFFGAGLALSLDVRPLSAGAVWALLYLGVAVTAGSFLAWYFALGRLGPQRASLFVGLGPLVAVTSAELLHSGNPAAWQFAGATLVAAGVAIAVAAQPARERNAASVTIRG
jgi:drug/metabolite transporter (DMT)-like permease